VIASRDVIIPIIAETVISCGAMHRRLIAAISMRLES